MCAATVGIWRRRFAERRMDGLYDEPRPDAPREIGDDEIAATIRKTPETVSEGGTHWSWRAMGSTETGHAPRRCSGTGALSACNRIGWRRSSCRPIRCWWTKCAISSGVAAGTRRCAMRRREISGTGARPRAAACADASRSGRPHDYTRHGTLAVRGAGCEGRNHRRQVYASPSGERVSQMSRRGRAQCAGGSRRPYRHGQRRHPQDQADPRLVGQTPAPARSLHTNQRLMDQSGRALLRRAHRTSLARGVFRSVAELEKAIKAYIAPTNVDPKPFPWTKTADHGNAVCAHIRAASVAAERPAGGARHRTALPDPPPAV